ncbi:MAG: NADH-dependent [FeFe] hydrogenase, group A6 [Thermoguttaceae bacterium]|jgi:NADH-quinone oxidoreductase subunit G/NADP-reducing hydrogenase subunit HndD
MISIEVNGRPVEAQPGEMLLSALRRAGIKVPTLCHIDGLTPTGACRMCVVEVEGQRGLVPSCAFPVSAGMKVKTHSQRAVQARKTIIELLLANHPDDCLYCVRNGSCELQGLAEELGVRQRRYAGEKSTYYLDTSSPSLVRDPAKCILCGKCVRVCEEMQGVAAIDFIGRGSRAKVGTAFDEGLNVSGCINCGQCINVCPTGALSERSQIKDVLEALRDPKRTVVVQHAPAVSVSLGEAFKMPAGADVIGAMTTALRRLGFDRVFDTGFTADLTIMEEGSELVHRLTKGGKLPMLTSCSPGWIKFVETYYPDFMDNLSTCKSPQQMMGAVIKSYFAQREGLEPSKIYSVSIMPCTAKKFEAGRPEMGRGGVADIDAVLTTRELAELIRMHGLDLRELPPDTADTPFGERTTAGKLFGATGGVMEAAIRSAYYLVTGKELANLNVEAVRGFEGVKEAQVEIDGLTLNVAVVSGLGNAAKLLDQIRAGQKQYHFIEVMTCPGGCINGGGQPIGVNRDNVRARLKALYQIDGQEAVRVSHQNESVQRLYTEFLGAPLGEKSHHLLHTHYTKRELTV